MTEKILIVDDTIDIVNALQLVLEGNDYQVSACYSGQEALGLVSREKPDIILLDVTMPGLSGFEVCEKLKQDESTRDIPIIMLSVLKEPEDKVRGLDCGAADFITKPCREIELLARVRAHLRGKRLHDELKKNYEELEKLGTLKDEEMAPPSQTLIVWNRVFVPLALALGFSLVFVLLRYIVFKGVPISYMPAYVFNKALAISSVLLMCSSYVIGPLARLNPSKFGRYRFWRKSLGITGLGLLLCHVCLAVVTLSPEYHPAVFEKDGASVGTWGISLALATLATIHLIFIGIISLQSVSRDMTMKQWLQIQRSGLAALALAFGHLGFLGYKNWFDAAKWYGGMMPSTLLAALVIIGTFSFRAYVRIRMWTRTP